jgi:hypothetical protein
MEADESSIQMHATARHVTKCNICVCIPGNCHILYMHVRTRVREIEG